MSPEDIENFRREWFEKLEPDKFAMKRLTTMLMLCVMWQLQSKERDWK